MCFVRWLICSQMTPHQLQPYLQGALLIHQKDRKGIGFGVRELCQLGIAHHRQWILYAFSWSFKYFLSTTLLMLDTVSGVDGYILELVTSSKWCRYTSEDAQSFPNMFLKWTDPSSKQLTSFDIHGATFWSCPHLFGSFPVYTWHCLLFNASFLNQVAAAILSTSIFQ